MNKLKETYEGDLSGLLKLFNIPIDETRINDYKIIKIDYSVPTINLVDLKDGTVITAKYTNEARLLNYSSTDVQFIEVCSVNGTRKVESLFYVGENDTIANKWTISKDDYDLTIERKIKNNAGKLEKDSVKCEIKYLQNMEYENRNVSQNLLSKVFRKTCSKDMIVDTFEQEYTYGINNYIPLKDSQDKYAYTINNNVIYGINELEQEGVCHYLNGICFEKTNVDVGKYLPYRINGEDKVFRDNNTSIIVFKGGTDNAIHHNIVISKNDDKGICLDYEAICWEKFNELDGRPNYRKVIVECRKAIYPKKEMGSITSIEIQSIIDDLIISLPNNSFIELVINELNIFANKIDIRKGLTHEELEVLSPKTFMNKTFDEISTLVRDNQDVYFDLISEEFNKITNNGRKEDTQVRVLKQN